METFSFEKLFAKEPYIHITFWCLYIVYPLLQYAGNQYIELQWWSSNSNLPLIVVYAYASYLYLFPARLKYKVGLVIGFTIAMTVIGLLFSKFVLHLKVYQLDNYSYWRHGLGILSDYVFVGLVFFSFYSLKRSFKLHNERKIAELSSLRAQINPHFLFNTLNSIYAYSLQGDNRANELLLKLADNFKYILKEGQQESVSVANDYEHIEDYINIHRIRWGKKLDFKIKHAIDEPNQTIASLLLISFVENAIKYTSKLEGDGHKITIDYIVENGTLLFYCKNPFNNNYELSPEWEKSGIGLKNAQSRLALIYPNRHHLEVSDTDSIFNVRLSITL